MENFKKLGKTQKNLKIQKKPTFPWWPNFSTWWPRIRQPAKPRPRFKFLFLITLTQKNDSKNHDSHRGLDFPSRGLESDSLVFQAIIYFHQSGNTQNLTPTLFEDVKDNTLSVLSSHNL